MVDASDHADLLSRMLGLNAPRMFMYGEQNAQLSYLPALRAGGVELASIPPQRPLAHVREPGGDVAGDRGFPRPRLLIPLLQMISRDRHRVCNTALPRPCSTAARPSSTAHWPTRSLPR